CRLLVECSLHFFFSSRRRHTRFSRDWSSDVCSSDLVIWLTPLYFHIYFTIWLFAAGFYQETFWLPAVSMINATLGVVLHQWGRRSEERRVGKVCILGWLSYG